VPINARSCKHLRAILGDKYEDARIKLKNPHGASTKASTRPQRGKPKGKTTSRSNPGAKRKRDQDEDDDEDGDNGDKPAKKARKAASKDGDDDDDDDNDDEEDEEEDEDDIPPVKKVPELLLANKWDLATGPDPTGWWMSEKLDGVR
jgi:DNA ligase 1